MLYFRLGTQVLADNKTGRQNQSMRHLNRRVTLFATKFALTALWGICFVRAYNLYVYTRSALDGSTNAATDFSFSQHILFCYSTSFIIGFILVGLACQRHHPLFVLAAICVFPIVALLILSRPESVIVMFPNLTPHFALLASLILAIFTGIGTAIMGIERRFHRSA
ncbi:hypothetical protein IAD21_04466 [Abditibacteriota bacterium]|nr:hypothetical protein IAD21_04466 [Abditibacteriota bacterium]